MTGLNGSEYYWQKLRYHRIQSQLWHYKGRFAAVVAGRRSGKTVICRRKLVLQLPIKKPWPDPLYYYVLPTYAQAKKVVWYTLMKMVPSYWIPRNGINKSELSITTKFGSKLYIVGADKPYRMEGNPADGVIVDEASDQKPDLYSRTILPMLAERNGFCYQIGVPKRSGIGRSQFRDFYNKGLRGEDGIASFYWKASDILDLEILENLKSQLTERDYSEQIEAIWQDIGSSVYFAFSENNNVGDELSVQNLTYNPTLPIYVGCDFNVDPMCWVLAHYIDDTFYVFDEIFLRATNTQATLDFLHNKYYQHMAGWKFYGDASSRARKTPATRTDYLIIKNDARFGQKKVFFPHRNPHIRDRVGSVNRAFKDARGKIGCYIHVDCKRLINDLLSVAYKEGTSELEDYKGTDIGHMADGFGYMIHSVRPVKLEFTSVPEVWST